MACRWLCRDAGCNLYGSARGDGSCKGKNGAGSCWWARWYLLSCFTYSQPGSFSVCLRPLSLSRCAGYLEHCYRLHVNNNRLVTLPLRNIRALDAAEKRFPEQTVSTGAASEHANNKMIPCALIAQAMLSKQLCEDLASWRMQMGPTWLSASFFGVMCH